MEKMNNECKNQLGHLHNDELKYFNHRDLKPALDIPCFSQGAHLPCTSLRFVCVRRLKQVV